MSTGLIVIIMWVTIAGLLFWIAYLTNVIANLRRKLKDETDIEACDREERELKAMSQEDFNSMMEDLAKSKGRRGKKLE